MPLGISLSMQEKVLAIIREFVESNKQLSGVIVKIENVGHGFCWGADPKKLEASSDYFQINNPKHAFSIVEYVHEEFARRIMQKIHRLNDEAGLPGIFNYLKSQQEAA